jgi:hypothetical protein
MQLHLNLRAEYFEAIQDGTKAEEFRLATPYWRRRLEGKTFSGIVLKKGYPKRGDASRTVRRAWRGMQMRSLRTRTLAMRRLRCSPSRSTDSTKPAGLPDVERWAASRSGGLALQGLGATRAR